MPAHMLKYMCQVLTGLRMLKYMCQVLTADLRMLKYMCQVLAADLRTCHRDKENDLSFYNNLIN